MSKLQPGATVQYRKVGKATLVRRASGHSGQTQDWVAIFTTGKLRTRGEQTIWIRESDVVTEAPVTTEAPGLERVSRMLGEAFGL